jgi:hypothetical protein
MATTNATFIQSPHTDAAKVILDKVRALRADIPRFVLNVPSQEVRQLVPSAGVPDPFLESASVAVQASPRLERATDPDDAARLRDAYAFAIAYDAIVLELASLSRAVKHTIRVARAEAGASALDIYAIAQRLSKRKDGAELLPHVEDMRRKLKKRSRKTNGEPAPAPDANATPSPVV